MRAALENSLNAMGSEQLAMEFTESGDSGVKTLGEASRWLEVETRRFFLRNVYVPLRMEKEEWVVRKSEGVFLLRLQGNRRAVGEVDHVVVVDSAKKVIWDSVSEREIRMEVSAFEFCVGDYADLVGVQELKQICKKPEGKRKRMTHKMSAEKRKEKREEKHEAGGK